MFSERLRQEDCHEFHAIQGSLVNLCLKTKTNKQKRNKKQLNPTNPNQTTNKQMNTTTTTTTKTKASKYLATPFRLGIY